MSFSAVILAGGKSSRMGRDKAFLEIDGRTLLARQIDLIRAAGAGEVFISGRAGVDYSSCRVRVLWDAVPDAGPLAGIHAALSAATQARLLVLAVDLAGMEAEVLLRLIGASCKAGGCIPRLANQLEPLAAVYPQTAVDLAERQLRAGRLAVRDFAEACVAAKIAAFLDFPPAEAYWFRNMNLPADLPCLT